MNGFQRILASLDRLDDRTVERWGMVPGGRLDNSFGRHPVLWGAGLYLAFFALFFVGDLVVRDRGFVAALVKGALFGLIPLPNVLWQARRYRAFRDATSSPGGAGPADHRGTRGTLLT